MKFRIASDEPLQSLMFPLDSREEESTLKKEVIRGLRIVPISQAEANTFVAKHHRHHKPVPGSKFQIAVRDDQGIRGVAIAGRPVARMLDNGLTIEVNRCCTDGARNACSILYGACRRIAKELGYDRIITYTLPEEGGSSLRATGWIEECQTGGGEWSRPSRLEFKAREPGIKTRWSCTLK